MREAFLNDKRSATSQSQEHNVNVSLTAKTRSLPYNNLIGELSAYQLYNNERDASSKYRMIFTVNPVCSNVLFNMKTEVMKDEGSDECEVLFDNDTANIEGTENAGNSTPLDRYQAIKDTEYSHKDIGGLTYHCGLDIFNNHMLRNDGFVHINKTKDDNPTEEYNTLVDLLRDCDGNQVTEKIGIKYTDKQLTNIHLYQHDTILSFYDAYSTHISEKNGWYGFTNPGNIEIPNHKDQKGNEYMINRMLLGNKACEYIDMYPDRSLYSFIPKYNKFRNRVEKNWNYAITYAYKSDKETFGKINGDSKNNAVQCFWEHKYDTNGNDTLCCRTLMRHNLSVNDRVRFYYGTEQKRMEASVRVISVGDSEGNDTNRYFSVKYENVALFAEEFKQGLWYRRESNGIECEYYFRKMKKITNPDGSELKNDLNKGAFAENIYGDAIAQVVYTDDIDVDGLKDNLGRPVSELYFTVVKNNAGYEKWYDEDNFTDEDIEYSHCFGKVTGGLDLGKKEDFEELEGNTKGDWDFIRNYNSRYIHNIDSDEFDGKEKITDYWGDEITNKPLALYALKNEDDVNDTDDEKGITINDLEFWGDVVEFSPADFTETVIETTYNRFNTAQRETSNNLYASIKYDELIFDDYDLNDEAKASFNIEEYYVNGKKSEEQTVGNLCPEGYFYKPNMGIKIKELSGLSEVDSIQVKLSDDNLKRQGLVADKYNEITINNLSVDYRFIREDIIGFYCTEDNSTIWGTVTNVDKDNNPTILFQKEGISFDPNKYLLLLTDVSVPTYARYIPSTGKIVWKGIVPPSELPNDSDIYDRPFANGCFYIETGFNIFVRRQDPDNAFGLQWGKGEKKNPMKKYYVPGNDPIDMSAVQYVIDKFRNICY